MGAISKLLNNICVGFPASPSGSPKILSGEHLNLFVLGWTLRQARDDPEPDPPKPTEGQKRGLGEQGCGHAQHDQERCCISHNVYYVIMVARELGTSPMLFPSRHVLTAKLRNR